MGRQVWVPVVSGPLAPYAAGFSSWLVSRAYSRSAAADRLYQFDQLSTRDRLCRPSRRRWRAEVLPVRG